jgi:hypothetical protein
MNFPLTSVSRPAPPKRHHDVLSFAFMLFNDIALTEVRIVE